MKKPFIKLHIRQTIKFGVLFLLIGAAFFFLMNEEIKNRITNDLHLKGELVKNYLSQTSILETDTAEFNGIQNRFEPFIKPQKIVYLIIENNSLVSQNFNLDMAEYHNYQSTKPNQVFDEDKPVYSYTSAFQVNDSSESNLYLGLTTEYEKIIYQSEIKRIGAGALILFLAGTFISFLFSYFSFRPVNIILKELGHVLTGKTAKRLSTKQGSEAGILSSRINKIVEELDKSTNQVELLNKQMQSIFRDKIYELNLEINQRRIAEGSLKKSEEQFRLLFENAPIGMMMVTPDMEISKVNKAFCDTVGYHFDELIQKGLSVLTPSDQTFRGSLIHPDLFEGKIDHINYEKKLLRKDGKEIYAIVKSVLQINDEGKPTHAIVQVLDITEIKRVQSELVKAIEKAEASDRMKSAFLAQMSHEIRTPLNVILTASPLIADEVGGEDEELLAIINSVRSAGKRLQRTIDLILNMSSVQSGNYQPEFSEIDIEEDLRDMMSEFKSLCEDKGLSLSFRNYAGTPLIEADKYTFNQIFQNLIGNAIKYTRQGFVNVNIKESGKTLIVEVEDSGIGMSENYLKNLFKPFSQEDIGQKREFEGNGLGLALVKKYVEINRGSISVKSEKNSGSVFTVQFNKLEPNLSYNEQAIVKEKTVA